ncbi:M23 family metallopeptidase [Allopusillimonas ginsengisoli]|uniref:M23 family metallopeptidase n=1 Tax=Allopusillimonas ginsengisoli TaxID=453575 RepID=UPI0039C029B3
MRWYKTFFSMSHQRILFCGAVAVLLTVGVSQNIAAEVLSFSIVREKFELHNTIPASDVPRIEQLRQSFLRAPLQGSELTISSGFGLRFHPVLNKQKAHNGVDYASPKGTPIQTTADGTVEFIGRQRGYGKVIMVKHIANLTTIYAHQSRFARGIKEGDFVSRGDTIGYVGSTGTATGNNLHYEVRIDDEPIDPLQLDRLYVDNEYIVEGIN